MTDINKQIEEEARKILESANKLPPEANYFGSVDHIKYSANDIIILLGVLEKENRWRKVSEEMPEDNESLLDNNIPDIKCTRYVLVKTRDGHIYENRRLKMAIGNKEWVWAMSVEGDTYFIEWKPID